jgi:hypothetical protein
MNKPKNASTLLPGRNKSIGMMADRYYVQRLTEQIYLIRECKSTDGEPGTDDPIVRSFTVRHDAEMYAKRVNDQQRKLDEQYGQWVQHPAL